MIALLLVLAAVIAALLLLVFVAAIRIENMHLRLEAIQRKQHRDNQTAVIASVVNAAEVAALRRAAEDWPSVDEESHRKRLSWTKQMQSPDAPPMPVAWLKDRADRIENE